MLPKDVKPYSVAVTPDESIYVAARSRHLFLMSPHGERRPTPFDSMAEADWEMPVGFVVDGDIAYVADANLHQLTDDNLHAMRVSDGTPYWSQCVGAHLPTSMVLHNGRLFVGTDVGIRVLGPDLSPQARAEDFNDNDDRIEALAIHGDELYVAHGTTGELAVYSLDGEYLRDFNGAFGKVCDISFHDDRLFMIEDAWENEEDEEDFDEEEEEVDDEEKNQRGRQLLVLGLDGERQQTIHLPGEESNGLRNICIHGGKIYLLSYSGRAVHVLQLIS